MKIGHVCDAMHGENRLNKSTALGAAGRVTAWHRTSQGTKGK